MHHRFIATKSLLAFNVHWHWSLACPMWMVSNLKRWLHWTKDSTGEFGCQPTLRASLYRLYKGWHHEGGQGEHSCSYQCLLEVESSFCNKQSEITYHGKILVEKWFSVFGIPTRIHSDQGRSFDNEIISNLCKMYGIRQSTTTPYNLHVVILNVNGLIELYLDWWKL